MLNVTYVDGAYCPFTFRPYLPCFLKAYGYGRNGAVPPERDKQLLQNSWKEIGREFYVSWMVAKDKWSCPLVHVLLNIHASNL